MPNSFFILLRYFLRVDNVMIRVNDTRIYHEFDQNYMLREFTSREAQVKDLRVSLCQTWGLDTKKNALYEIINYSKIMFVGSTDTFHRGEPYSPAPTADE